MIKNKSNTILIGLKKQFEAIVKEAEEVKGLITGTTIRQDEYGHVELFERYRKDDQLYISIEDLREEYNLAADELNQTIGVKQTDMLSEPTTIYSIGNLYKIIIKSKKAIGIIESLISPLSAESENLLDKLHSIREEIGSEIKDKKIKENLLISVNEFENAHFLASCLITARIIDYVVDKIPLKDKSKGNENVLNNKINYLIEQGTIDKKAKDVQESILKSAKKARNVLSHEIETNITSADAIALLGDCIKLTKLLINLL